MSVEQAERQKTISWRDLWRDALPTAQPGQRLAGLGYLLVTQS